jgi:hypothetical protein
MNEKNFLKKEWPKLKHQLMQVSQEAMDLAKKGEGQLRQLSHQGKLQIDLTALTLKKEHLYLLIGQEFIKAKYPGPHSSRMKKYLVDFRKIERQMRKLKRQMRSQGSAARRK